MTIIYPIAKARIRSVEPLHAIGLTGDGDMLLEDRSGNRFSLTRDALEAVEQARLDRVAEEMAALAEEAKIEAVQEALDAEESVADEVPKPKPKRTPRKRKAPAKK